MDPAAWSGWTHPKFTMPAGNRYLVAGSPIMDRLSARYYAVAPMRPVLGPRREPAEAVGDSPLRAGEEVVVPVPAGRLRAVTARLPGRYQPSGARAGQPAWLVATLRGPDGRVVGRGERRLDDELTAPPGLLDLPLPELAVPHGSTVTLTLRAPGGQVALGAGANGRPVLGTVRAGDDRLRLRFTRHVVIYERATALPRFRWASAAEVVPDPGRRVELLAAGRLPADTVVLARASGRADGSPARVRVEQSAGDQLLARVRASREGYLVVADALQFGWQARLDGEPVPLVSADHAGVAVHVPRGDHRVELRYEAPGLAAGMGVSALSATALALLAANALVSRRRCRPRRAQPAGGLAERQLVQVR
jgi:hypothetical protein